MGTVDEKNGRLRQEATDEPDGVGTATHGQYNTRPNGRKSGAPTLAVVPFELIADERIKPGAFRVLTALLAFAARDPKRADYGWAFPSQKALADHLGLAESTVAKHLKELDEIGVIEIRPRRELHDGFNGHWATKAYRICSFFEGAQVVLGQTDSLDSVAATPQSSRDAIEAKPRQGRDEQTHLTDQEVEQTSTEGAPGTEKRAPVPPAHARAGNGEEIDVDQEIVEAVGELLGEEPEAKTIEGLTWYVEELGEPTVLEIIGHCRQFGDAVDSRVLFMQLHRRVLASDDRDAAENTVGKAAQELA